MRLWTIHPKYLDRQGLVALWREGLLAQAVLRGRTKGYKSHPQLNRFKAHPMPHEAIAYYLHEVQEEAKRRGYRFDAAKIDSEKNPQLQRIQAASGQVDFELMHLLGKLEKRSKKEYDALCRIENVTLHPLFELVQGEIEDWEKGAQGIDLKTS